MYRVTNGYFLNRNINHEWRELVHIFTIAFNTAPHIETQFASYELLFEKLPYLPGDILEPLKANMRQRYLCPRVKTKI